MTGESRVTAPNAWPDLERFDLGSFLDEQAAPRAEQPFLLFEDRVLRYGELAALSRRAANGCRSLGVGQGDRVCLLLPNCPEFVLAWFGLARLGAIAVPINTDFGPDETGYILEHCAPRAAVTTPGLLPTLQAAGRPSGMLGELVLVGGRAPDDGAQAIPFEQVLAAGDDSSAARHGSDPATLIYTSGTTGRPKAVIQTHRTYVLTGQAFPWWLGLTEQDRLLTSLPLFHINAQAYSTMGALGTGASLALLPRFSASRFWDDVRRHQASQANVIGAMLLILAKQPPRADDRDHSLRLIYSAPALPEDVRSDLEERFGLRIVFGYAMSESTFGTIEPLDGPRAPGSMGRPRQHPDPTIVHRHAIVDEAGQTVPPEQVGEIVLAGPAVTPGYFRDDARTAEALRGGWLYTGDLARRDQDDNYFFVDRKKDVIRRRGENISSVEVEQVLAGHPAVLEVAVIGVPSELSDEEVVAYVTLRPDAAAEPDNLFAWCAERLARFKVPSRYELRGELPRTATQRIAKHVLKAEARANLTPLEATVTTAFSPER